MVDPAAERAPDLLDRDFVASAPNRCWAADFTHVATWNGGVYVAFVVDTFSRRIVGWSASTSKETRLVLDALEMALWQRDWDKFPHTQGELIHHSDSGSSSTHHSRWPSTRTGQGSRHRSARSATPTTVRMGSPPPGWPDWCYDPSGVLTVDLSVTPSAGLMRAVGRVGSDRIGAFRLRHSSQSCPPARPTASR
ncbi:DDE-type integrase/transposase/recombinase [Streptomyces sp. ISL-100]|uniref:DDE-type integrase/transposase/recombinase n=1 Tax=Streptomyces sp. ISL-100 TaxID=2819173 RepID=UPI001BE9B4AB|nr:DDE-type integrase/transposase/recombinase [Streptomyces sp. ISL-100]